MGYIKFLVKLSISSNNIILFFFLFSSLSQVINCRKVANYVIDIRKCKLSKELDVTSKPLQMDIQL